MMSAHYLIPQTTLEKPQVVEYEIKKSQFICEIAQTPTLEKVHLFCEAARARYPDASHHCYAFIAGAPTEMISIGFSDDGEPNGSAGRPILRVLQASQLGQITATVTRYFGGTKLGVGNLARAYSQAVKLALAHLPNQTFQITTQRHLQIAFEDEARFYRWCKTYHVDVEEKDYQVDGITFRVAWPCDLSTNLTTLNLHLLSRAHWL